MKTKSKALLLTLCAVLLVAASVLGTMAYLTSTDTVTNTFTVGKVEIKLDETDVTNPTGPRVQANSYKLMPGTTYTKDPTVTVKAGSQPGDEVVLDGLGVGRLRRKGRGDLHVSIVVETPTRLDDRQRELLAELARLRGEDDVEPVRDSSVMGKLKERFSGR